MADQTYRSSTPRKTGDGPARQAVIVIAGMHRSGTSATGGVLQALGIELPGQLIQGQDDNPKGFFENERIVLFHEALLRQLDSAYDEPLNLREIDLARARADGAVGDLARILGQEIGQRPLSAFKDPRACRLLLLWKEALEKLDVDMLVAVPLRDPKEVAASLARRNLFSEAHGLLLWLNHTLSAELASRKLGRSFFHYASLLDNWRSVTAKIADDLDIEYPRDRHEAGAEIEAFLTRELRHHSDTLDAVADDDLRATVAETWAALSALCGDPYDAGACATLDAVRERLRSSERMFAELVRANRFKSEADFARIIRLEEHAADINVALLERDERLRGLYENLSVAGEDVRRLSIAYESEREGHESEREKAASSASKLSTAQRIIKAGRRQLSGTHHLLEIANNEAAVARHDLVATLHTLDRHRQEAETVAQRAARVEGDLQQFQRSGVWRIAQILIRLIARVPAPARRAAKGALRPLRRVAAANPPEETAQTALEAPVVADALLPAPDATPEERQTALLIEESVFFDEQTYEGTAEARDMGISPALHYVLIGEDKGYGPSRKFDPAFYGEIYPDIGKVRINRLGHYIRDGVFEGRLAIPVARDLHLPEVVLDPERPTVLVIAHEASRTGAPILAWNIVHHLKVGHNVLTLLLGPGDLTANFIDESDGVIGPLDIAVGRNEIEARYIVARLRETYPIDFVIANSIETRAFATAFSRRMVPVVALSHEFASYVRPHGALDDVFELSDEIVFSAEMVLRQSERDYPVLAMRPVHVLPQGQSAIPPSLAMEADDPGSVDEEDVDIRPEGSQGAFLVVGLGTVQHRKGVDLFISAASVAVKARPDIDFRFVWYGHGYRPDEDVQYSAYLQAQIEITGLEKHLEIRDPVVDLDPVYRQADVLALTSRLDPLPNVSIDAGLAGLPVVCFDGSSGFADVLLSDPRTAQLVVPHLDSTAAGHVLAALAGDAERRSQVSAAIGDLSERTFRMEDYVARLARLGLHSADRAEPRRRDAQVISQAGAFDPDFYRGSIHPTLDDEDALAHYLSHARNIRALDHPEAGLYARSPMPGFHPLRFAQEGPRDEGVRERDPLAQFILAGRPAGPWVHRVITPDKARVSRGATARAALHGHFRNPERVPGLLEALAAGRMPCDLFLTVTQADAVEAVEISAAGYENGAVTVQLVADRGRDIAPFLAEFAEAAADYDIVGHVHDMHDDPREGGGEDNWRTFLWQHLLGADHAMADIVLDRMSADPTLGLVIAADPNLVGWGRSRKVAQSLSDRLGLSRPLPDFFSFPIGTMFWARREAIRPLFELGLGAQDYPEEPLAEDGTILHAIERLIPHVVAERGFTMASTHVPGFTR